MDIYVEQIVKKEESDKDRLKKWAIAGIYAIISFFLIVLLGGAAVPIILALWFLVLFLVRRLNVEWEYILTNDNFDIDCIYNKSRRKTKLTFNLSSVLVMAHIDNNEKLAGFEEYKVMDFSSEAGVYANTYVAVLKGEKGGYKLILEPNEKMLEALNQVLTPKRLFKKN